MRTLQITLLILCFVKISFAQKSNSNELLIHKVDEKIPMFMQEKNVPGMAIAIFEKGHVIFNKGYGVSNIEKNHAMTSSTGFNIGSISKVFTAFAIMRLVENGKLDLDAPVENYLKSWHLPDSKFDNQKVTIRHLLDHTAGISVHGYPGFTNPSELTTVEASLNGINGPARADEKVEIVLEPQTKFKYSGGGYTILQLVIEDVTQIPFELFMEATIFKPLKMNNTTFMINDSVLKQSAVPYNVNKQAHPFEFFTAKAAAGLQTTLDDFILFVNDMLHKNSIISKDTFNKMITPTSISEGMYGLGFRVLKFGPIEFKGHAGTNTGWQSAFFFDFKTKSGLIMMTNGDEGDAVLKNTLKTWASVKYHK